MFGGEGRECGLSTGREGLTSTEENHTRVKQRRRIEFRVEKNACIHNFGRFIRFYWAFV